MNDNFDPSKPENRVLLGTVDWDSGHNVNRDLFKAIRIDPYTHALHTIGYDHHEIHAGEHHFCVASTLVSTGGSLDMVLKFNCLPKLPNITLTFESALASTVKTWGPGKSTKYFVPGNAIPSNNRNHYLFAATPSLYTSPISICINSGGTETESPSQTIHIGSAGVAGKSTAGGEAGSRNEIVAHPSAWYRLQMISRADNNALTMWLDWYEHAPNTPYPHTI
ncbi:MAG: hypothetical protein ACYTBJ_00550 [Planctomycetota bacterium]|jgi:hypothetical protein